MTKAAKFTQTDVKRAVKGAAEAGLVVGRFRIDPLGNIEVFAATAGDARASDNPWDRLKHAS